MKMSTDLALEAKELASAAEGKIEGVESSEEKRGEITITKIRILNEAGSKAMGKPAGEYVTIELSRDYSHTADGFSNAVETVAGELSSMLGANENETVLVVGLGNESVTPDALGPLALKSVLVTRHIKEELPDIFKKSNFSPVAAIAPGVMGQTGVETAEIITSLIEKVKPDKAIVIDALSARRLSRLATTVQLTDTGINPGSGIGNSRAELSKNTLGIPVVAVGMPTVVGAATLTADIVALMSGKESDTPDDEERNAVYAAASETLQPYGLNLFVTPKEIDGIITNAARMLGYAVNRALHKEISAQEMGQLLS